MSERLLRLVYSKDLMPEDTSGRKLFGIKAAMTNRLWTPVWIFVGTMVLTAGSAAAQNAPATSPSITLDNSPAAARLRHIASQSRDDEPVADGSAGEPGPVGTSRRQSWPGARSGEAKRCSPRSTHSSRFRRPGRQDRLRSADETSSGNHHTRNQHPCRGSGIGRYRNGPRKAICAFGAHRRVQFDGGRIEREGRALRRRQRSTDPARPDQPGKCFASRYWQHRGSRTRARQHRHRY